jgi:hypothetical protein
VIAKRLDLIRTDLRIELEEGGAAFGMFSLTNTPVNCQYEPRVTMGRSIGVRNRPETGTMGGYIFDTATKKRYGITNAHVCAADYFGKLEHPSLSLSEGLAIQVVQNSDQDYEQCLKAAIAKKEQAHNRAASYGFKNPDAQLSYDDDDRSLRDVLEQDREFGFVKAVELGLVRDGMKEKCWKDFAVIDVSKGKALS